MWSQWKWFVVAKYVTKLYIYTFPLLTRLASNMCVGTRTKGAEALMYQHLKVLLLKSIIRDNIGYRLCDIWGLMADD
jgi:hypothetical protein